MRYDATDCDVPPMREERYAEFRRLVLDGAKAAAREAAQPVFPYLPVHCVEVMGLHYCLPSSRALLGIPCS